MSGMQTQTMSEDTRYGTGDAIALSSAVDINDLMRRIASTIEKLGFTDYSFIYPVSAGIQAEWFTSLPEELVHCYCVERLYQQDLLLEYAATNTETIFLSELHGGVAQVNLEIGLTRSMRHIYEIYKSFGFYESYNIPLPSASGVGQVMFSVAMRGSAPSVLQQRVFRSKDLLQVLAKAIDSVVYQNFSNLFLRDSDRPANSVTINDKPLRVLDALANNDANIGQVADKLCISVVTANKHLETARKAFGAKTNYAAIKKAVLSGLIVYEA